MDVDAEVGEGRTKPVELAGGTPKNWWNQTAEWNFDLGSTILDVLAMEMQEQSCGRRAKTYNPNPKVADYENGEEVLELMLGE